MDPLLLALALGAKHSLDADHLAAMGAMLRKGHGSGWRLGGSWALGHAGTAAAITAGLYVGRPWAAPTLDRLEVLAPLALIAAGVMGLWVALRRVHEHQHTHADGTTHSHPHGDRHHAPTQHRQAAALGAAQGLASNGELLAVLVVALSVGTLYEAVAAVLAFTTGVAGGMVAFALVAGKVAGVARLVPPIASAGALCYGVSWLL